MEGNQRENNNRKRVTTMEKHEEKTTAPKSRRTKTIALALAIFIILSGFLTVFISQITTPPPTEAERSIIVPPNINATLRVEWKGFKNTSESTGDTWAWISIQTSNKLDINATIRALAGEEWVYGNLTLYIEKKKHAGDPYQYYTTLFSAFVNATEAGLSYNYRIVPGKGYYKVFLVFNMTSW